MPPGPITVISAARAYRGIAAAMVVAVKNISSDAVRMIRSPRRRGGSKPSRSTHPTQGNFQFLLPFCPLFST